MPRERSEHKKPKAQSAPQEAGHPRSKQQQRPQDQAVETDRH